MEKGHVIDFAAARAKIEAVKAAKAEALRALDLSDLRPDETFTIELRFDGDDEK